VLKVITSGHSSYHFITHRKKQSWTAVKDATMKAMEQAASVLGSRGIQVEEMLRMGYPDEEIIRAAEENRVSMIVIHALRTVIELTKQPASYWMKSNR